MRMNVASKMMRKHLAYKKKKVCQNFYVVTE